MENEVNERFLLSVDAGFIERMYKRIYNRILKQIKTQIKPQLEKREPKEKLEERIRIVSNHLATFALNNLITWLMVHHHDKIRTILRREGETKLEIPQHIKTKLETMIGIRISDLLREIDEISEFLAKTCNEESEVWVLYAIKDFIYTTVMMQLTQFYNRTQIMQEYHLSLQYLSQLEKQRQNHVII